MRISTRWVNGEVGLLGVPQQVSFPNGTRFLSVFVIGTAVHLHVSCLEPDSSAPLPCVLIVYGDDGEPGPGERYLGSANVHGLGVRHLFTTSPIERA